MEDATTVYLSVKPIQKESDNLMKFLVSILDNTIIHNIDGNWNFGNLEVFQQQEYLLDGFIPLDEKKPKEVFDCYECNDKNILLKFYSANRYTPIILAIKFSIEFPDLEFELTYWFDLGKESFGHYSGNMTFINSIADFTDIFANEL